MGDDWRRQEQQRAAEVQRVRERIEGQEANREAARRRAQIKQRTREISKRK